MRYLLILLMMAMGLKSFAKGDMELFDIIPEGYSVDRIKPNMSESVNNDFYSVQGYVKLLKSDDVETAIELIKSIIPKHEFQTRASQEAGNRFGPGNRICVFGTFGHQGYDNISADESLQGGLRLRATLSKQAKETEIDPCSHENLASADLRLRYRIPFSQVVFQDPYTKYFEIDPKILPVTKPFRLQARPRFDDPTEIRVDFCPVKTDKFCIFVTSEKKIESY